MKKLYEELMGRVEVTDEMKTRILSRIQAESLQMVPSPKAIPFWNYKRFASLAACFAILAVGVWSAINIKAPVAEPPLVSGYRLYRIWQRRPLWKNSLN